MNVTPPKPTEHQIQSAFFDRVRMSYGRYPDLEYMRAFPNGGHRHKAVAAKMHAEGVSPGPLDVILPTKSGPYVGLWMEFKRPKNKLTDEQQKYAAYLRRQGWCVEVVYSEDQAWKVTMRYLSLKQGE